VGLSNNKLVEQLQIRQLRIRCGDYLFEVEKIDIFDGAIIFQMGENSE